MASLVQLAHSGAVRCDLSRYESGQIIQRYAGSRCNFVIATFRNREPMIYGMGPTLDKARAMAIQSGVPFPWVECSRVPGERLVWRSASGETVTIEDFREV